MGFLLVGDRCPFTPSLRSARPDGRLGNLLGAGGRRRLDAYSGCVTRHHHLGVDPKVQRKPSPEWTSVDLQGRSSCGVPARTCACGPRLFARYGRCPVASSWRPSWSPAEPTMLADGLEAASLRLAFLTREDGDLSTA